MVKRIDAARSKYGEHEIMVVADEFGDVLLIVNNKPFGYVGINDLEKAIKRATSNPRFSVQEKSE